jgi:iron complex transport system ATP-binding protein
MKEWSKEEGHSVIGVMHDINLAMHFADKILLLSDGQVAMFGDAKEFTDGKLLKDTYQMDIKGYMQESLKIWETR